MIHEIWESLLTESLAQGYIHVWTLGETRGMEKHLKIFPFLKWLSYQSCHIQRAFCRASSSNNFHIYLIQMLCFILSCDQVKARVGNYILWPSIGTKQLQCMTLVTAKKHKNKKKYGNNISLQSCIVHVFGI